MTFNGGLVNGLLLGLYQETVYMVGEDENSNHLEPEEASAIHLYLLLFRLTIIFD